MMATKLKPISFACEICGQPNLNEDELKTHMLLIHIEGAISCPFCDLGDITADEMVVHVRSVHLDVDDDLNGENFSSEDLFNEVKSVAVKAQSGAIRKEGSSSNLNSPKKVNKKNNKKDKRSSIHAMDDCSKSMSPKQNLNDAPSITKWLDNSMKEMSEPEGKVKNWSSASPSPSTSRPHMSLSLCKPQLTQNKDVVESDVVTECPICQMEELDPYKLQEHINRKHFDITSPSCTETEVDRLSELFDCPFCSCQFTGSADLEIHVNIEHKNILSPDKQGKDFKFDENLNNRCPVCSCIDFMDELALRKHIDEHFENDRVEIDEISFDGQDVKKDSYLAQELDRKQREMRKQQEEREFEMLRAQYGMDNHGNFHEQSLTNMQQAVYNGEMSVSDYYEKQIELKVAEQKGMDDGSSCTKGLISKIQFLSWNSPQVVRTLLCTSVDHYATTFGDKGWGCGYRNIQMLLSSLQHNALYLNKIFPDSKHIPAISKLQDIIESAWNHGFDPQGSEQLGGKLKYTRKWIGATEVVAFLSFLRIRCELIDFHHPTGSDNTHPRLLQWVEQHFSGPDTFKVPLYLQHQGHSRTIIGMERLKDGSCRLLVFDPSHRPTQMNELKNTQVAFGVLRLLRKPQLSLRAKQYQIVRVSGLINGEDEYNASKIITSLRIP